MRGNCQSCFYKHYKESQKPCSVCVQFDEYVPELDEDEGNKIDFFVVVVLILITVFFANVGLILFNLFK